MLAGREEARDFVGSSLAWIAKPQAGRLWTYNMVIFLHVNQIRANQKLAMRIENGV